MAKNYQSLSSHGPITVQLLSVTFAVADTSALSDLLYIGGSSIVALFIPGSASGAAWVAANIAVYAALSNGSQTTAANYAPLYKPDGTQYVFVLPTGSVPATGLFIQVDPYDFVGLDAVQLQSVSTSNSATALVQTNSPSVTLVTIGNGSF